MRVTVEIELHPNQYNHKDNNWRITHKGREMDVSEKYVKWFAGSVREEE